jgi:hypothetical protein
MIEEAADSGEYIPTIPAELEPGNQRELLHQLKEIGNTQAPEVQVLLQAWISDLDALKVTDVEGAWAQAQLYDSAGLREAALAQLERIFQRLDNTDKENRTNQDKAIGNLAADMEDRLLEQ